jgi:hypothetical protein
MANNEHTFRFVYEVTYDAAKGYQLKKQLAQGRKRYNQRQYNF